jgi:phenylpyruvate tautomerase PptA (4-oxalocrotonate tautomerase family)
MPYVNCRVIEGVLTDDQKAEIAEQFTETIGAVSVSPFAAWRNSGRSGRPIP